MAWFFSETPKDYPTLKRRLDYLQHERLIHLLVMLTVGLATLLTYLGFYLTQNLYLLLPASLLTALFIPYLFYYRKLETIVHSWYQLLEKI